MPDSNDIIYTTWVSEFIGNLSFGDNVNGGGILEWLTSLWNTYSIIALLLSVIFFLGFVYARIRHGQMEELFDEELQAAEATWQELYGTKKNPADNRWAEILSHVQSFNPNDWKAAIIDADIMLEEALTAGGFPGQTVGDRLKSVPRGSFQSLNDAWEAHKIRNMIAHESSAEFVLTQKIAQQAIVQFERALRELGALK